MTPTRKITQTFSPVRKITHAAFVAAVLAAPFAAQAGPIDKVKSRVEQTHAQVRAIRGRVNAIYGDLQEKREMLGAEGKEQLMEAIRTTVEYMQHARADYAGFVGPDQCGPASECGAFREELKGVIQGFIALPADLPFVENVPATAGKLEKIVELVDRAPPPMLYAAEKSISGPLGNVQNLLDTVRAIAAVMPKVPTIREINDLTASSAKQYCSVVLDNPHIELMQTAIHNLAATIADLAGLLQETVDVVAAVGTNIKNPLKLIVQIIGLVPKQMERNLKLRKAALKSQCALLGVTK